MVDLHMHSIYSEDGDFTPAQLVEQCARDGVELMSVTDHNSVRANDEARAAAKQAGIGCITGVEMDCRYRGRNFHVLGYGIDASARDFFIIEQDMERQYRELAMESLKKTCDLGFRVTPEEMRAVSEWSFWPERWTGERFAEVILDKPEYMDHPMLAPYRSGGSRSDNPLINFYWDFYSQGKPCYVPMEFPGMERVVQLIHDNGGLVVLAHPGNNLAGALELFPEIMALGFDGVEAFSSYHSAEQADGFCRLARQAGKFCTCGSDFHGRLKPAISLGGMNFPPDTERAEIERELHAWLDRLAQ